MKHLLGSFLLISFLLILPGITEAQDHQRPIAQIIDGQVNIGEYGVGAENFCQPPEIVLSAPAISPDGWTLLLETRPRMVTEAIEQLGPVGGGALPNNFWRCDLRVGMLHALAQQPPDASFAAANVPDRFAVRGNPHFSPDSASIAWMEDRTGFDDSFLVIYDLASGQITESQPDLFPLCCVPRSWSLFWGEAGIWLYGSVFEGDVDSGWAVLVHMSESGDVLDEIVLESEPTTVVAALDGEVARMVLIYSGSNPPNLLLVDPATNEVFGITPGTQGYLELYNPLDPGGLSLIAVPDDDQIAWVVVDEGRIQYQPDGAPVFFVTDGLVSGARQFAPSPGGQLLLWQGMILYGEDGEFLNPDALLGPVRDSRVSVFWGPRAWRIARPRDPISLAGD